MWLFRWTKHPRMLWGKFGWRLKIVIWFWRKVNFFSKVYRRKDWHWTHAHNQKKGLDGEYNVLSCAALFKIKVLCMGDYDGPLTIYIATTEFFLFQSFLYVFRYIYQHTYKIMRSFVSHFYNCNTMLDTRRNSVILCVSRTETMPAIQFQILYLLQESRQTDGTMV